MATATKHISVLAIALSSCALISCISASTSPSCTDADTVPPDDPQSPAPPRSLCRWGATPASWRRATAAGRPAPCSSRHVPCLPSRPALQCHCPGTARCGCCARALSGCASQHWARREGRVPARRRRGSAGCQALAPLRRAWPPQASAPCVPGERPARAPGGQQCLAVPSVGARRGGSGGMAWSLPPGAVVSTIHHCC